MTYQITPYAVVQFLTGSVSIITAILLWKRRTARGGWPLFLLFVMASEWAFANAMEAAAVPLELKITWAKIVYFGALTAPVFLVLFALQYTGTTKRITAVQTAMFFLIPLVIITLAITNKTHQLIWVNFLPGPEGTNSVIYQHGPAFWVSAAYVFSLVFVGMALLVRYTVKSQKLYRKQSWFFISAAVAILMLSTIYLVNFNPFPGLDLTSVGFLFAGLIMVWGMRKERLLDIVPIAHELILENLNDGALVIDDLYRIIDINTAAEKLLSQKRKEIFGSQAEVLGDFWVEIQDHLKKDQVKNIEIKAKNFDEVILDARISPLNDKRTRFLGWVVILADISLRKKVEIDLNAVNDRLKQQLVEIQELQAQLQNLVMRDSLTGVYNRRFLGESLKQVMAKSKRDKIPVSIIMLDVDYFKTINDKFGHKAGDDVLVSLSQLLRTQTRESDCVSRYGGDEFVLVLSEMSRKDALQRAELLRNAAKALTLQMGEEAITLTISIGVSTFPENGDDGEALLKSADGALYLAKAHGRDRTCLAE